MNQPVIAFKVPALMPAFKVSDEKFCAKKNCCKKFKKGKRCKKCPGRAKIS